MPLWRIFSHPDTFSPTQRQDISSALTKLYAGLPAFYVIVLFIDLPTETSCFVGGEAKTNFVRITVEQIARTMPDGNTVEGAAKRRRWLEKINEALKPYIIDRSELEWELHISETPRDLWTVQGLPPPPPNSEAEKMWVQRNKAVPYEKL